MVRDGIDPSTSGFSDGLSQRFRGTASNFWSAPRAVLMAYWYSRIRETRRPSMIKAIGLRPSETWYLE